MKSLIGVSCAIAALVLASGCAPMPQIDPVEKQARRMLSSAGKPFSFHVDGEPIDLPGSHAQTLSIDEAIQLTLEREVEQLLSIGAPPRLHAPVR